MPLAPIGTPLTKFAHATPNSNAAAPDAIAIAHSHVERHRADGTLPQNSNDTPRTISAARMRNSAR